MSHCTCDYHQEQNKYLRMDNEMLSIHPPMLHQPSEEKKDWERATMKAGDVNPDELVVPINIVKMLLKEEQEKWRLKNAGLYRQLFGEENRTYTSKELWEILDSYAPLFTEEQKKELKDNLNSIMK